MRNAFILGMFLIICSFMFTTGANAGEPTYVGSKVCGECHKPNFEDWSKSRHGNAFKTLVKKGRSKQVKKALRKAKLDYKKDYSADEKCVKCHVVGYQKPGGFVDFKTTPDLVNVQCEMCHGPGSEYIKIHKAKGDAKTAPGGKVYTRAEIKAAGQFFPKNDEKVCRQCHDHKDSPFNKELDEKYMFKYEEMVKLEKAWHKINKLKFDHK